MTADIIITIAMASKLVTPKPSIIKLTISNTTTVTPDIGQFDDPTSPVK